MLTDNIVTWTVFDDGKDIVIWTIFYDDKDNVIWTIFYHIQDPQFQKETVSPITSFI